MYDMANVHWKTDGQSIVIANNTNQSYVASDGSGAWRKLMTPFHSNSVRPSLVTSSAVAFTFSAIDAA